MYQFILVPLVQRTDLSVSRLGELINNLTTENQDLTLTYESALYESQLIEQNQRALEEAKTQIEAAYEQLKSEETTARIVKIDALYTKYQAIIDKVTRNQNAKLTTETITNEYANWGVLFLTKKYDELDTSLTAATQSLDLSYTTYLATIPTATPKPTAAPTVNSTPTTGYSYQQVATSRGTFNAYVIKLPHGSYRVKTLTANSENCANNCPAKSLADYVSENSAYAGMNGTYFCPPDYASCSGKTYSYDFAVYNSNLGTWLNSGSLTWNDLGMASFNGDTSEFIADAKAYGGQTLTAAIVNFPSLVGGNAIIVDPNKLSAYQRDTRGLRGAIGSDGTYVYLVIISGASVVDAASVMQTLGATDALNLDGGGSSALYINGTYKVGPGRLLPNAVVVVPS